MTNSKNTKRALYASVISMLLCVTMLIGSTFAWFTDNASTKVNTIQAGKLEVVLEYWDGDSWEDAKDKTLEFQKATGHESETVLWEPGVTYNLNKIRVRNAGNLALKYKVEVSGINGDAKLNEVIDWTYNGKMADGTEYNLSAGADSGEIIISGHMQETANNDYQGLSIDSVSITVYATQYTEEYDSTNNQYDANATYDSNVTPPDGLEANVGTAEGLKTILQQAADDASSADTITINLTQSFDVNGSWTAITPSGYNGTKKVVINGNGNTIKGLNEPLFVGAFGGSGSITFNNLTIENANISGAGYNNLGLGAFAAYSDNSGGVTLNDCKLVNSTVTCTGEYAGGLIGYSSTPISISNCSVTGSTITSAKSAGAVIGQDANAGTMNGITVTGCTINATGDSKYCGTVVGTSNANASVYTNVTTSGNTINGTASETYYGRAYVGLSINGTEYVQ